jgi:hypothetical protein
MNGNLILKRLVPLKQSFICNNIFLCKAAANIRKIFLHRYHIRNELLEYFKRDDRLIILPELHPEEGLQRRVGGLLHVPDYVKEPPHELVCGGEFDS